MGAENKKIKLKEYKDKINYEFKKNPNLKIQKRYYK